MKKATWTIAAQYDLAGFDDHYRPLDPDYADRLGFDALQAARFLAERPEAGPSITRNSRKWLLRRHDVVLVHRILPDSIEILRVHHARQDWRPGA